MHSSRPLRPLAGGRRYQPWSTSPRVLRARRRRLRVRRLLRAAIVLAIEIGVVVLFLAAIRQDPAPADTPAVAVAVAGADAVAADPASYRDAGEVRVRGRILEYPVRVSKRDRGTFILVGESGRRLAVVPARTAKLPAFRAGMPVIVRGTVVIPPDSKRMARRSTSRTAIAARARAPALIKAAGVASAD